MLPYLRVALFAAGATFFSLFAATAEKFLIEILRRWIPIDPANQILFNGANVAVATLPLIGVGLLLHIAIGSEKGGKPLLWNVVSGVVLSVAGFRIYQVCRILTAVSDSVYAPSGRFHLFILDHFVPFLLIGLLVFLPFILSKSSSKINVKVGFLSVAITFLWLWGGGKLQPTHSILTICTGYIAANLIFFTAWLASKKLDLLS